MAARAEPAWITDEGNEGSGSEQSDARECPESSDRGDLKSERLELCFDEADVGFDLGDLITSERQCGSQRDRDT